MKTKHTLLILASFLLFNLSSVAQEPIGKQPNTEKQKRHEKIKAMKVAYITTKLELTSGEAEKFWPVYNEFSKKTHEQESIRRKKMKENKGKELSDKEINELIKLNFDTEQKVLDLKRAYDSKFKAVLSVKKVGKLYIAEKEFKREMLKKMKEHKPHSDSHKPTKE